MASADHRVIVVSKLSEKLASKGLDDAIIEELMEVESRSLCKLIDFDKIKLRTEFRFYVLNFLRRLLHLSSSEDLMSSSEDLITCYIKAVQLFDLTSKRALDNDSSIDSVMALAAAAWLVSTKMMFQGPRFTIEQLTAQAEACAGFPVMTGSDVQEKEMTLLLSFNISVPTCCTWCELFSARLDAIFDGALLKSGHLRQLQKVNEKVLTMAMNTLEVSENHPPYMIAAGSFCFSLALTGLLPLAEVIHPSAIASTQMPDNASMEAKFAWFSQFCGFANSKASPVPVPALLAAMQVAVHCCAQSLRLATSIVAYMLAHPPGDHACYAETTI